MLAIDDLVFDMPEATKVQNGENISEKANQTHQILSRNQQGPVTNDGKDKKSANIQQKL